jgi:hypothetical protein
MGLISPFSGCCPDFLDIKVPFLTWVHFSRFFFYVFQRNLLDIVRFKGDGLLCTGFNALGFSTAEVTHVHNFIKDLKRPDRAGFFTHAARSTQRRRDENLSLLSQTQGILRTFHAVALLTLNAHNGGVQTGLIEIQYFYPGEMIVDSACVEERAGRFTPLTTCAFTQVNTNHANFSSFKLAILRSYPAETGPIHPGPGMKNFSPF